MKSNLLFSLLIGSTILAYRASAQHGARFVRPDAVVDLRTDEGVRLVDGKWRYSDARILDVDHFTVGTDLKPSGSPVRTHDITPKAGQDGFDDSSWQVIPASSLEAHRSNGGLSFAWYRINVTVPAKLGNFDPTGGTIYFEISVDDYAEVWVDGKLPQVLGQSGGQLIKGWNAPNRVLLTRNAQPGQHFQIAVFGANGPLSDPPPNYIWIRSATLDFYTAEHARVGVPVKTEIERLDPALDEIIAPGTQIEQLADGFRFTEGPVWIPGSNSQDGYLLFSDPNNNTIYRWSTDGQVNTFRTHSGYTGTDIGEYHQPGSNGLAIDPQGRLTINEHGNHRVTRLEKNGVLTVLADNYQGKRLNSPNDLVYRSDGALFFTDPPFGLPRAFEDPRKELSFSGVYCLKDGSLKLISTDLTGPNGIAFSPDEKYLYVTNWDEKKKVVMRYECASDGTLSGGVIFFDMTSASGEEALDGMKIDSAGNLFVSGPGGLWIISASGKHVGTIRGPQLAANLAWGAGNGQTLYLTARSGLYRLPVVRHSVALRPGPF